MGTTSLRESKSVSLLVHPRNLGLCKKKREIKERFFKKLDARCQALDVKSNLGKIIAKRTSRSVNKGTYHVMNLVSLLVMMTVITLANSLPKIYAANSKAKIPTVYDHLLFVPLLNHGDFEQKIKPLDDMNEEYDNSYGREKRIGSLSIANPVDVLRERILLELARRKALEDQRQISENRRLLDTVGKRSGKADRCVLYVNLGMSKKMLQRESKGSEDTSRVQFGRIKLLP